MTRIVGVTGNIASGKSTVAALLGRKGATVIDADALARAAVAPGSPGLAAIAVRWPQVIRPDGTLDRTALRRIVFADADARAALNAIVHPAVARRRDDALAEARARNAAVVVYDVPLLFEAGLQDEVDLIVLVDAPADVRLQRLLDRGLARGDAQAMMAAQIPASESRHRADVVIENDGDEALLATRVDALWDTLAHPGTRD